MRALVFTLVAYLVPETAEQSNTINDHPKLARSPCADGNVYQRSKYGSPSPKIQH